MGRKSLLKSTQKKSQKPKKTDHTREVEKKKAILEDVPTLPGSIKANLKNLGLAPSTYYGWQKRFKAKGLEGLESGAPVSDKVWQRFTELKKTQGPSGETEGELKVEEKRAMTNQTDKDKKKELLFRKFDEEPAKGGATPEVAEASEAKDTSEAASASTPPEEPMDKTVKYAIGAFAFVLAVLLMASFSNSSKFYFKQSKQAVELWQGRFAPMGEKLVATFPDLTMIEGLPRQESYSKKQAHGVVFDYLVGKADDILYADKTPDLKTVRTYLGNASKYATSRTQRQAIQLRLNSINFLVLSGKADLALAKGGMEDFEAAKRFLAEAIPYASTDVQKETVTKRLAAIEYAMATSKISKGEKQLANLYREALTRHLHKAKQYAPEKSEEIDQEIAKIKAWLDEFDRRHVRR